MAKPPGYHQIEAMFGANPLGTGNTWFFDSTSTGDPTGESPEKALRTAADWNVAKFQTGDNLVIRTAPEGIEHRLEAKVRNMRAVGSEGQPFCLTAYRMENGLLVYGRGPCPRPLLTGGPDFDVFNVTDAELLALAPGADANPDGTFKAGSGEGLLNWYRGDIYDLFLWMQGIGFARSNGRAVRFTQSRGGLANGLLVDDCYAEKTAVQAFHLNSVRNFIVRNTYITQSGWEVKHAKPPKNRQATIAAKGDHVYLDEPVNGFFDDLLEWDTFSSEVVNSNSGLCGPVSFLGCYGIDAGKYGVYVDRTRTALVQDNTLIRTGRPYWFDAEFDYGAVGVSLHNEEADGAFPLNLWPGPEGFDKFKSQNVTITGNWVIGYTYSYGLQSQASCKPGSPHYDLPFGRACNFYNNKSIRPKTAHWNNIGGSPEAYHLDTDPAPTVLRQWQTSAETHAARPDNADFNAIFRDAILNLDNHPLAQYEDLAVLMETTGPYATMTEAQAVAFRERIEGLKYEPLPADLQEQVWYLRQDVVKQGEAIVQMDAELQAVSEAVEKIQLQMMVAGKSLSFESES